MLSAVRLRLTRRMVGNQPALLDEEGEEVAMPKEHERCEKCDEPTGRAGSGEDSLYIGPHGPLCEECFEAPEWMQCELESLCERHEKLRQDLTAEQLRSERLKSKLMIAINFMTDCGIRVDRDYPELAEEVNSWLK